MAANPVNLDDSGRQVLLATWQSRRRAIVAQVARETGFTPFISEVVLAQLFDHLASPSGDLEPVRRAVRELQRAERVRAPHDVACAAALHLALTRALRAPLELHHSSVVADAAVVLSQVFQSLATVHGDLAHAAAQNAAERRALELERELKSLAAAQERLLHQARLKAMGSLADGVAHEVNNSLNAVLLRTTLLDKQISEEKAKAHLKAIETVVRHAAATVQRLQEFARRRTERSRAACDASAVAREAVEMTRPHWTNRARLDGGHIEMKLDAPDGLPAVQIDAAELRAIVVDLLLNSTEAITGDGAIEVVVRYGGGQVEVEVHDSGPGIPPELLRRIFEPFFTTRGPRSSGLGLAMAYGVLDRVGGSIAAENREGGGAVFRLTLPCAEQPETAAPSSQHPRTRTILLVDDDADSRETLEQILELRGHRVELAADGRQALALYDPGLHEAVLCDVSMPNMDGLQLARAIRQVNPGATIALLTGWGADVAASERDVIDAVFQKPIDIEAVSRFVERGESGPNRAAHRG